MENIEIIINERKIIKTVTNFEQFKDVIRVFQGAPYYEILSDQDCRNEYGIYEEKGLVLGYYVDDKLTGINCIINEPDQNHSIIFPENEKVAYYSGLAVKPEYRGKGIGKLLVNETDKYLENLKLYKYSYARILCQGSMSAGIFYKNGFRDAYDLNNELIVDIPEYEKNAETNRIDTRKYMVKRMINTPDPFRRR